MRGAITTQEGSIPDALIHLGAGVMLPDVALVALDHVVRTIWPLAGHTVVFLVAIGRAVFHVATNFEDLSRLAGRKGKTQTGSDSFVY